MLDPCLDALLCQLCCFAHVVIMIEKLLEYALEKAAACLRIEL